MRLELIFTMRDIYINANLDPLTEFTSSSRTTEFKDPPMDRLSDDHKGHPNQHNNIHNLCNETGLPLLSLAESQGKLRQQHDQNVPMEGKPL